MAAYNSVGWADGQSPHLLPGLLQMDGGIKAAHDRLLLFDVLSQGARNDGSSFDNIPAINAAITAANAAGGGKVVIPDGVYEIRPSIGNNINMKDNVTVEGMGYGSQLKVRAANGDYNVIFSGNSAPTATKHARIRHLRINQNSANVTNTDIQDGVRGQYAVYIEKPEDFRIEGVYFDTCSGINTVTVPPYGGNGIEVSRCYFNFLAGTSLGNMGAFGYPAGVYDNSTVYIDCMNHRVVDNTFLTQNFGTTFGAIETHHGFSVVSHNTINGYMTGVNVVGPQAGDPNQAISPNNHQVSNNTIVRANNAIQLWPPVGFTMRNVQVSDNVLSVSQIEHDKRLSTGIGIAASGALEGVAISGNSIYFQEEGSGGRSQTTGGTSLAVYEAGAISMVAANDVSNVLVSNNLIVNAPLHAMIFANLPQYAYRNTRVAQNVLVNAGHNEAVADYYRNVILGDAAVG